MKFNKHLTCIYLIFFLSVSSSEVIYSGKSKISNDDVYFESTEIMSFGKIVTGNTTNKYQKKDNENYTELDYQNIYFCNSDELLRYGLKTYSVKNNTKKLINEENFENFLIPIEGVSNSNIFREKLGYEIFIKHLKKSCSTSKVKYPKIKIPIYITPNEDEIDFLLLDTLKSENKLKVVWTETRKLTKEAIKNIDGSELKNDDGSFITIQQLKDKQNYTIRKVYYDCKNSKIGSTEYITYDYKGNVIESNSQNLNLNNLSSTIPNSIGEFVVDWVCKVL